jgi:hypothetical protein
MKPANNYSSIGIVLFAYTAAHVLLIVNNGMYWDDWNISNLGFKELVEYFCSACNHGGYAFSLLHGALLSMPNYQLYYHVLTFAFYLGATLFFWAILKYFGTSLSETDRLYLTLFFALFPVNNARIAIINFPAGFYYFLFFTGFYCLAVHLQRGGIFLRVSAVLCFFLSFFMLSTVVFYGAALATIAYVCYKNGGFRRIVAYTDFFLLPVVFWIVKILFFTVHTGPFAGHYEPGLKGLVKASFTGMTISVLIIGLALASILHKIGRPGREPDSNRSNLVWFLIGGFLFILAVLPYAIAGMVPTLYDWNSRLQLLVPAGASLMLYFSLKLIFNWLRFSQQVRCAGFAVFLTVFIIFNITGYLDYQGDWYKQLSLIQQMKENAIIKDNTTFLFKDETLRLNAMKRTYNFYEYSGIMKRAFGDEKRFGASNREQFEWYQSSIFCNKTHSLSEYIITSPQYIVAIRHGIDGFDRFDIIKFMVDRVTDKRRFESNIRRLVAIECTPIPG